MQSIEFTITGTMPILFGKEPQAYEESPDKAKGRQSKDLTPVQIAKLHLHIVRIEKAEVIVIPAHSLRKSLQYVTGMALGRSPRQGWGKLVKGGVIIEPAYMPIDPQDWTLDIRRAGTKGGSSGTKLYRPRFDIWSVSGIVSYDDKHLEGDQIRDLFDYAGRYDGLGSYRIGTGGPFGSFKVTVWLEG